MMAGEGNRKKRKVYWISGTQTSGRSVAQPTTRRVARRGKKSR